MARTSSKQQSIYEQVESGKRLVSIQTAGLPALKVWLWRNGYTWKTNKNGDFYNVLIDVKSE